MAALHSRCGHYIL